MECRVLWMRNQNNYLNEKKISDFGMWCFRKVLEIPRIKWVTNEEALDKAKEKFTVMKMYSIQKR